jgi:hypothetical protein
MIAQRPAAPATLFNLVGQLPHGLLRDCASFATFDESLRHVHGCQNFRAAALALFPQGKSFLHSLFLTVESSAFNGLADKRFLIGGKIDFHTILRVGGRKAGAIQCCLLRGTACDQSRNRFRKHRTRLSH